ncbi:hypothetical protein GCM10007874_36670 [Labrys miyagiensis]|uniref:Uncharacterized protein n=1 Tax=Labrys miyagiensis TaxID=346912 RepID=A0ABQ6CP12_9HYPH|nr:hypothetical protein [Labrys miyagiensis]GLS20650.1 hypothetical protein GCM10007874_36670 [Labrys miyagiensis]
MLQILVAPFAFAYDARILPAFAPCLESRVRGGVMHEGCGRDTLSTLNEAAGKAVFSQHTI